MAWEIWRIYILYGNALELSYTHYSQCFQKACFLGASKGVIVWEWVKSLLFNPFPQDKILDRAKLKAFADDKLNVK